MRKHPIRYVAQPQNFDHSLWWVTNVPRTGQRQKLAGKNLTEEAAKALAEKLNAP